MSFNLYWASRTKFDLDTDIEFQRFSFIGILRTFLFMLKDALIWVLIIIYIIILYLLLTKLQSSDLGV